MPKIAFYKNCKDNNPVVQDITWGELVVKLTTFPAPQCSIDFCQGKDCPSKNSAAWSPVDIDGLRANKNVRYVTHAVFDLDGVSDNDLKKLLNLIGDYSYILHSTHSHTPDRGSYRLILKLSRPCPAKHWRGVWETLAKEITGADMSCGDLSRIYFLPTSRVGITPVSRVNEGVAVDVDYAVQEFGKDDPRTETVDTDVSKHIKTLRETQKTKANYGEQEKSEILKRIVEGLPLAESGNRDNTLLRAAALLAYHLPKLPWEVVKKIISPSLSNMPCDPEGWEHWEEVARKKYERALKGRLAYEERKAADEAVLQELIRAAKSSSVLPEDLPSLANIPWQDLLIGGREKPSSCEYNVCLALKCAPEVKKTLRWNVLTRKIEVFGGKLAGLPETLDNRAAAWLQRDYGIMVNSTHVRSSLLAVARENEYDPIGEYLKELAWDGVSRIDNFLEKYLGVTGNPVYVKAVSRRWLISLVARALYPGCKVDTVLILEGPQGAKKSSAFETLVGGKNWFLDTSLEFGSKETMQLITSSWLVELSELASFKGAESEKVKAFITSKNDKFRPPYGASVVEFPRRSIFVGTTNDYEDYLHDQTGNRRYWPVKAETIDLEGIKRDREQLLAEAVTALIEGERWWLEEHEAALAAVEAGARTSNLMIMELAEAIERWWLRMPVASRPEHFSMLTICESALNVAVDKITVKLKQQAGQALKHLGFKRTQKSLNGRMTWVYTPTDEQASAPALAKVTPLPIKGGKE